MTATPLNEARLTREFTVLLAADRVRACRENEFGVAELVIEPQTVEEIGEVVRKCESDRLSLAPLGASRTLTQIRRDPVAIGVSMARMNRIVAYEPDDMTVVVEAGATLGAVNRMASERGQRLTVDPPMPDLTTIGSLIAGAKTGPLRLSEGTVRDLLIGIAYVGREGRVVRAGGRVVKNVTGYDLMKVMIGSFGTLGIITEAAFKIRPVPARYAKVTDFFPTIAAAFNAASRAGKAAPLLYCEIFSDEPGVQKDDAYMMSAAVGGIGAEVGHQCEMLLAVGVGNRMVDSAGAEETYVVLQDACFPEADLAVQISVMPSELVSVLNDCNARFRAHALSGVAELFLPKGLEVGSAIDALSRWRSLARQARGHVRVLSARADLRPHLPIFDQPNPGALALMHRLKSAFDPHNVFNPNCFVGGL